MAANTYMYLLTICAAWACTTCTSSVLPGCTENQINECNKFLDLNLVSLRSFQSIAEPKFTELCKELDEFDECTGDFIDSCNDQTKAVLDAGVLGGRYMCHEGRQTYLKHRECFSKDSLDKEGVECSRTYAREMMMAQMNTANSVNKVSPCRAIEKLLDCGDNAVERFCGKEAAAFQRELQSRSLQGTANLFDCSFLERHGENQENENDHEAKDRPRSPFSKLLDALHSRDT